MTNRGAADFGFYANNRVISHVYDMGEIAARLGSKYKSDRGGKVIFTDGFEGGLGGWTIENFAGNSSAIITSEKSFEGAFSLLLRREAVAKDAIAITRKIPAQIPSRFGYAINFNMDDNVAALTLNMQVFDGTNVTDFGFNVENEDDELQIQQSVGLPSVTSPIPADFTDGDQWHFIKAVGDHENGVWDRHVFDDVAQDISDKDTSKTPSANNPTIVLKITMSNKNNLAAQVFIDSVFFTVDE